MDMSYDHTRAILRTPGLKALRFFPYILKEHKIVYYPKITSNFHNVKVQLQENQSYNPKYILIHVALHAILIVESAWPLLVKNELLAVKEPKPIDQRWGEHIISRNVMHAKLGMIVSLVLSVALLCAIQLALYCAIHILDMCICNHEHGLCGGGLVSTKHDIMLVSP